MNWIKREILDWLGVPTFSDVDRLESSLCKNIDDVSKKVKDIPVGYIEGEIRELGQHVLALEKYLGVKAIEKWVDDPSFMPTPARQIKITVVEKIDK